MTDHEAAEWKILSLGSEKGKFAIPIGATLALDDSYALERLQLRGWIRLIDVSTIAAMEGVFRIFLIMPEAAAWFRKSSN